ncbi:hypothetical protein XMD420_000117 [Marinobacterium sp. xm-d-420]|uniref:glycosyltransferase n=1 Tax=Marinobacterium sp. xm-d-420 TaxID=2497737 RepID=UPI00156A0FBC|nr:glycosyltransferase [Marinobacterium sp. xm-d-420]NRP26534.1 hypothetical protein [Marinobacterium sp. xm-d-420]
MYLLIPINKASENFYRYFDDLLNEINVDVKKVGSATSDITSPDLLSSVKQLFVRFKSIRKSQNIYKFLFGSDDRIYLFPEPLAFIDSILSIIFFRKCYVYIHEPKITIRKPSSLIKHIVQIIIIRLSVNIGVGSSYPIKLLFPKADRKRENTDNPLSIVLFFGAWIKGKVDERIWKTVFTLKSHGFLTLRAGFTDESIKLPDFDEIVHGYVDDDTKHRLFQKADFVFLPYKPTAQSGIVADCLSYGIPVLVDCLNNDIQKENSNFVSVLDLVEGCYIANKIDYDSLWDRINKENISNLKVHFLMK